MGTYVRVRHNRRLDNPRTVRATQASVRLRMAPQGACAAGQLLPAVPQGLQTRALRGKPRALHRQRPPSQAGDRAGTRRPPRRVLSRATVRGLRGDRSDGA